MTAPVVVAPASGCPEVDCRVLLAAGMQAAYHVEVTVSVAAPLVRSPWEPWVCCHGTHYWLTPTVAQRAVWAREVPA